MTVGKRIRFIRTFRNITQKELGLALGFDSSCADIRISQYEADNRKGIKDSMLHQMADILHVHYNTLKPYEFDNPVDVLESFFWFEEEFPMQVALFRFQTDESIEYPVMKFPAANGQSIEGLIAVMFALPEYRACFDAWQKKKSEFNRGEITREEYVEWKLNWTL